MYQLILEPLKSDDDREVRPGARAILLKTLEDGYKTVAAMAESEDVDYACEVVLEEANNCPVAVLDADDVLSVPDEITPTEAARARYGL